PDELPTAQRRRRTRTRTGPGPGLSREIGRWGGSEANGQKRAGRGTRRREQKRKVGKQSDHGANGGLLADRPLRTFAAAAEPPRCASFALLAHLFSARV